MESHNNHKLFPKTANMLSNRIHANSCVQQHWPERQERREQQRIHFTLCNGGHLLFSVAILICLLTNGISQTNAVPTDSLDGIVRTQLLQRALRDVTAIAAGLMQHDSAKDTTALLAALAAPGVQPPSISSASSATVAAAPTSEEASSSAAPSPQAQGLCLLDGALVVESTVFCEKQPGCRAIQKTGHCCPDYKCDCEKDGQTYSNGDKLVDPETPCTVCYCQGGEILCSSVTCFHRDDCSPKYIAGRCCPEYDNCPVSNPDANTTANKTIYDSPLTTSMLKPEAQSAALNPKITIKEITKPTEIRITDENKAIPIHQMLKPSTTEPTSTPTSTIPTSSATPTTTTTTSELKAESMTTLATNTNASMVAFMDSEDSEGESNRPDKHYSMDTNSSANTHHSSGSGKNKKQTESLKLSASVAYDSSSEKLSQAGSGAALASGIAGPKDAAASLEENRNGGSEKVFGSFGEQGLQRVEPGDANNKVNIKREFFDTTEAPASVAPTQAAAAEESAFSKGMNTNNGNGQNAINLNSATIEHSSAEASDADAAGSDNIFHICPVTKGSIKLEGSRSSSSSPEGYGGAHEDAETPHSRSELPPLSSNHSSESRTSVVLTDAGETVAACRHTTQISQPVSTERLNPNQHQQHLAEDEDSAIPAEANPAYPSLPEDDFSLRDVNFPIGEGEEMVDEPRSIGGHINTVGAGTASTPAGSIDGSLSDAVKSTKHLEDISANSSGGGSGDNDGLSLESAIQFSSSTEPRSPTTKISLMYSAEDVSEETAVSNASDFEVGANRGSHFKERDHEAGSGESLESESVESFAESGSGAGSAESITSVKASVKHREPTTPRPTRRLEPLNIDEIGSADDDDEAKSPADDPKLDAESLKLDENHEDGIAKTDAASAGIAAQEKTLEEEQPTEVGEAGAVVMGVADMLFGDRRIQRLLLQRFH